MFARPPPPPKPYRKINLRDVFTIATISSIAYAVYEYDKIEKSNQHYKIARILASTKNN